MKTETEDFDRQIMSDEFYKSRNGNSNMPRSAEEFIYTLRRRIFTEHCCELHMKGLEAPEEDDSSSYEKYINDEKLYAVQRRAKQDKPYSSD